MSDPLTRARDARGELQRFGYGILAALLVLIGGLVAINQLIIAPRSFGNLEIMVTAQPSGRRLVGAALELRDDAGAVMATGHSDEEGMYRQGRMPEGRYLLRISAPPHQPLEQEFQILSGEVTRIGAQMLRLQPPAGVVEDRPLASPGASEADAPAEPSSPGGGSTAP